jgi:hypothetical protein
VPAVAGGGCFTEATGRPVTLTTPSFLSLQINNANPTTTTTNTTTNHHTTHESLTDGATPPHDTTQ